MRESHYRERLDKPHIVKGWYTGKWMVYNLMNFTIEDRRYAAALDAAARMNGEPCAHDWAYIGSGHKGIVYECRYCGEKGGL